MTHLLDQAEIERRLPLWTALSDLFLDTDVMLSVPYIARTIVDGGWSIADVEDALRWEVRPAFYRNLLDVAGEWTRWPRDVVRQTVLDAREPCAAERLAIGHDRFMPSDAWPAVVAEVERLRQDEAQP